MSGFAALININILEHSFLLSTIKRRTFRSLHFIDPIW